MFEVYIQQEAAPALKMGVAQQAQGPGAPVEGRVVQVVHRAPAVGQRGASPGPGAPGLGDGGDPPPLAGDPAAAQWSAAVSQEQLRRVPPQAAGGPDEGP